MSPFRGGGDADAARRADESLRALEAVGLPLAAQERLAARGRSFTSDLSVPEFLLAREGGFRPLTQVLGSCFYHVGYQWLPSWSAGSSWAGAGWSGEGETIELETQTEAWNEARRLALGRLAEEARLAGADAVVGVRIERGAYDWAAGLIEFVATGTAVASDRYDLGAGAPVLSNLSGQEFAQLFRHGWWPAGIVAGSTVCYVVTGARQQQMSRGLLGSWQNQELPDFTRGLYDARSRAMLRATRQAHELGAHGLVGLRLDQSQHERERDLGGVKYVDLVVTLHVLGTAIVELEQTREPPPIFTALSLTPDEERS